MVGEKVHLLPEECKEGTTWSNRRMKKKDKAISLDGMEAVHKMGEGLLAE